LAIAVINKATSDETCHACPGTDERLGGVGEILCDVFYKPAAFAERV